MPLLSRRSMILAKLETTYGQDAQPAGTNAILVTVPSLTPTGTALERDFARASISPLPVVVGEKFYEITFDTELKGSGDNSSSEAILPEIHPLILACGFTYQTQEYETNKWKVTYTPVSTNFPSVTIYCYYDGVLHKIVGARGTFTLTMEAGNFGRFSWTFRGLYAGPVDQSMPTPTFKPALPPVIKGIDFTLDNQTFCFQALTFELGNSLTERRCAHAEETIIEVMITARNSNGSLNPEMVPVATYDFFGKWSQSATMQLSTTIGSQEGNTIVITAPKVQYRELRYGDRDGIRILDIGLRFAENQGNDEIQFEFK